MSPAVQIIYTSNLLITPSWRRYVDKYQVIRHIELRSPDVTQGLQRSYEFSYIVFMAELHFGQNYIVFNQNTMIFKMVTKNMNLYLCISNMEK